MEKNKMKILIIDDDEMVLKSLAPVFLAEGFEVITANKGDTGLVEALNKEPNIVITDVQMDNVDGMEVLKEIRLSGDWGKNVPIILLTNYEMDEKITKGIIHDQPSLYLLKSKVDPQKILVKVKDLLNISQS